MGGIEKEWHGFGKKYADWSIVKIWLHESDVTFLIMWLCKSVWWTTAASHIKPQHAFSSVQIVSLGISLLLPLLRLRELMDLMLLQLNGADIVYQYKTHYQMVTWAYLCCYSIKNENNQYISKKIYIYLSSAASASLHKQNHNCVYYHSSGAFYYDK